MRDRTTEHHRAGIQTRVLCRRHLGLLAAALAGAMALTGGCAAPGDAFARAERATYEAVAPEYLDYVAGDATLADAQKERRRRTVATWDLSLREHESTQEASPR